MNFMEFKNQQEEDISKRTTGPGMYLLNPVQVSTEQVFPTDPASRIQKSGAFTAGAKDLIDIDSKLLNIERIYSKDPSRKHLPGESHTYQPVDLKDGFYTQESTLLRNPPFELRSMTINNFTPLFFNPQENVIESDFIGGRCGGENTYLDLIDNYEACPSQK